MTEARRLNLRIRFTQSGDRGVIKDGGKSSRVLGSPRQRVSGFPSAALLPSNEMLSFD